MSYVGSPAYSMVRIVYQYQASAGQQIFSGSDVNGQFLAYTPGFITAFVDGKRLSPNDYTATNGLNITINAALPLGSEVLLVTEAPFNVANVYTQAQVDQKLAKAGVTLNDSRTQGILTSKLLSTTAVMFGGISEGFKSQGGLDLVNSVGAFADTVNGALIGGVGGATFVMENTSSLPKMTSNTQTATGATGYVASASSINSASQDAYGAFAGDAGTTAWTSSAGVPQNVALKVPSAIKLAGYAVTSINNSYAPTAWVFEGSNDGSAYTPLDTQTGIAQDGARRVYTIATASQGSYLYHRLRVTAGGNSGDNGKVQVNELELLQYTPAFESHPSLPAMTSNTTVSTGATGYTAFASPPGDQTGTYPWNAFSKTTAVNGGYDNFANQVLPTVIGLQVPTAIKLGGYAIAGYYDGTNNQYITAWQLQASNDGTNWTTLDTRTGITTLSGGGRGIFSIPPANQGLYTYHRLYVTAASDQNGAGKTRVHIPEISLLQVLTGIEGQTSIPYMTGANTVVGGASGYAVTADNTYSAGYEPWRVFNGLRSTIGATNDASDAGGRWLANGSPHYVTLQLPSAFKFLAYRVQSITTGTPLSWKVRGSTDGINFNDLDVRTVGSNFWSATPGDWAYFQIISPGSYRYYQIYVSTPGPADANVRLGEVEFLQGTTGNMDLRSAGFIASATPTTGSLFIKVGKINAGALTAGTTLTAALSRDGTNWTNAATLAQTGTMNGQAVLEANGVDLSSQPVGQTMKYRIQTSGGLGLNIDGVDLRWS